MVRSAKRRVLESVAIVEEALRLQTLTMYRLVQSQTLVGASVDYPVAHHI
jgi:hypothetical protein